MDRTKKNIVVYPLIRRYNLEQNIDLAIERRQDDSYALRKHSKYYLDYHGYHIELDNSPCTGLFLKLIQNNSSIAFRDAEKRYTLIYNHPSNKGDGAWHQVKRFVIDDDENLMRDIRQAIEDAKKHSVRACISGHYTGDKLNITKYEMVMTNHRYQFNPWAFNEVARIEDEYLDAIDKEQAYTVTAYL